MFLLKNLKIVKSGYISSEDEFRYNISSGAKQKNEQKPE